MDYAPPHHHFVPQPPGLPPHCVPDTPLLVAISQTFDTCIPNYVALVSTICGLLSIVSWLFAQIPQIYKSYERGSVEGVSLGFLAMWLAGDICNLLGALWTGQMWFQRIIGAYYVFVDLVLVIQFFYYTNKTTTLAGIPELPDASPATDDDYLGDSESDSSTRSCKKTRPKLGYTSPRRPIARSLAGTLVLTFSLLARAVGASPLLAGGVSQPYDPLPCLTLEDVGKVLSWVSTLLYLTSRLPQLLLNAKRRSTEGLAIQLFVAAFLGNFFYSASLLLNPLGHADYPPYGGGGLAGPDGNDFREWWRRSLPFFLGAAGVLTLDAVIGWQWWTWGEGDLDGEQVVVVYARDDSDDGFGGLEKSGWGWWRARWNGWWTEGEETERKRLIVQHVDGIAVVYGSV